MKTFAVLASGHGSLLEAILMSGLKPALVVTDRDCRALKVAKAANITRGWFQRSFGEDFDRVAYTVRVRDFLHSKGVELIAVAGYMTFFSEEMFLHYAGKILNTHPSLLPAFPGAHPVRDALARGVKLTGYMVHIATPELDHGPILAQAAVPVVKGDDALIPAPFFFRVTITL